MRIWSISGCETEDEIPSSSGAGMLSNRSFLWRTSPGCGGQRLNTGHGRRRRHLPSADSDVWYVWTLGSIPTVDKWSSSSVVLMYVLGQQGRKEVVEVVEVGNSLGRPAYMLSKGAAKRNEWPPANGRPQKRNTTADI